MLKILAKQEIQKERDEETIRNIRQEHKQPEKELTKLRSETPEHEYGKPFP